VQDAEENLMTNNARLPARLFGEASAERSQTETAGVMRILQCRTESTGYFRQRHHVRDLPPFGEGTDVPAEPEGDDGKPSPPEALLAALGSCLSVAIHAAAIARSIPIRRLQIELKAEFDFGALWSSSDPAAKSAGIETISIVVHIDTDAPRESLKALVDHAVLRSPVGNTLHNPVHLDIALAD
jgi:uncharacterized OsmC-like protein